MDQAICENSSQIPVRVVGDSHEKGSLESENEDLEVKIDCLGNHEMQNVQETGKKTDQDVQETASASQEIKSPVENPRRKPGDETEGSHMIDLRSIDDAKQGFGEKSDGETVCRICHLSSNQSPEADYKLSGDPMSMDLIQIGCGCKDELGIAHVYCAEAWFKLKGNRTCEICGETAKNVTGLGVQSFMEEWNEHRLMGFSHDSSNNRGRCWRGQPLCNFLLACLIIAFVLPWFFHIDIF